MEKEREREGGGWERERRSRMIMLEYRHFLLYISFAEERAEILSTLVPNLHCFLFSLSHYNVRRVLFRSFHEAYNEILSRLEA